MNSASALARSPVLRIAALFLVLWCLVSGCSSVPGPGSPLARSLLFHASFDHGVDADIAVGSRGLSNAPSVQERAAAVPGLPADGRVRLAPDAGVWGGALRFTRADAPLIFFPGALNAGYTNRDWSGTVSFWLRVDPAADLAPGYCDPIQLTSRAWNDAAFFTEFEKRTNGIPFRLGVYPDFAVWNPGNRRWEDLSPAEKPVLAVDPAPFSGSRWTHVVFTFEHFNTGRADGVARLYLDGVPAGTIPPRVQTFVWDESRAVIMLGVGYVGLWDELAIFNRALSPGEVAQVHRLPGGIASLRR